MTIDKFTLNKIKKCLELAKRGGTEGEAASAMASVQKLLLKHNLSMEEVEKFVQDSPTKHDVDRALAPWERIIWGAIAQLYLCNGFVRRVHVFVIGKESNIAATKEIATYVCDLGRKLARAHTAKTSFKNGFSDRIKMRCAEEILKAVRGEMYDDSTGKALVVSDLYSNAAKDNQEFLSKENIKVRDETAKDRRKTKDASAYMSGFRAAGQVALGRNGIESQETKSIG